MQVTLQQHVTTEEGQAGVGVGGRHHGNLLHQLEAAALCVCVCVLTLQAEQIRSISVAVESSTDLKTLLNTQLT